MISLVDETSSVRSIEARMSFGETIKRLRERAELSQEELASAAKLSRATIQNVEKSANRKVRGSSYRRLAEALGISLDELEREASQEVKTLELPAQLYDAIIESAAEAEVSVLDWLRDVAVSKTIRVIQQTAGEGASQAASRKPQQHPQP